MRARNIKPGFFKNEDLAALPALARILFSGLWCLADSRGVVEDRPKRIKAEILPYDDADVDDLLTQLHRAKFIVRYEVGCDRGIYITTFLDHQRPYKGEKDLEIPLPPEECAVCPTSTVETSTGTPKALFQESLEKEQTCLEIFQTGLEKAQTSLEISRASPESSFLSSESCSLNPSSAAVVEKSPQPSSPDPPDDDLDEPPVTQASAVERPRFDEPTPPQTWHAFLAREWVFYFRGPSSAERNLDRLGPFFAELIEQGITPHELRDRIRARDRPKDEFTWQFKRFFSRSKANGRCGEGMAGRSRVRSGRTSDALRAKLARQAASSSPAVEERIAGCRAPPIAN